MENKLEVLIEKLEGDMDAALITSPINRRYYTGFNSSAGVVVATRKSRTFIIDSRYFEAAQRKVKGMEVVLENNRHQQIRAILEAEGIKRLAVESDRVSMSGYLDYKKAFPEMEILFDNRLSDLITAQRQIKTSEEISLTDQAQQITDRAFNHILTYIRPGLTELEVTLELETACRRFGSSEPAFTSIVVSGQNSSMPHGVPTEKPLEKGDFLTMDFGCTVGDYHSDMTRTVAVGHATEKMQEVYQTVLSAQLAAIAVIKEGIPCKEVDKTARDLISKAGYGEYFGHGLGHAIGLEVHENPRFNTVSEVIAKAGLIMSVEPGIYLPGQFGVRIEDMVLVTQEGCRNFTQSPKELIVV
ncbi:Xaa-Pro peptidase family protein [Oscillospiraceae bacterium MB08-C2-2]|nr:Xaa-Pro peptidase family protein [Oscillospiraceae bacterium MB08-C2-2]